MRHETEHTDTQETLEPGRLEAAGRRLGAVVGLGVIAASGAVIGAFHDPVEGRLGPHRVEATATLDSHLSVDFGPFDSIDKPVDLPFGAGTDVVVKGNIKEEIEVEDYARFLSNPESDIEALEDDFKERSLQHAAIAVAGFLTLRLVLGKEVRELAWQRLNDKRLPHISAAVLLGGGSLLVGSDVAKSEYSSPIDSIFDGTVLEGARVNGPIMDKLINELAPEVFTLVKENDAFYKKVRQNLQTAAEDERLLDDDGFIQTALFYTDNHCNLGMAEVIGDLEKLSGASTLLDGGDTTMGGTEFEAQCLSVIADATKGPIVFAAGNHDSETTKKQAKNNGFKVLNGAPIIAGGLTVLGDEDPHRSKFIQEISQKGSEDAESASARLAKEACRFGASIDVLLVHDQALAKDSLEEGCVDLALSGHSHKHSAKKYESGSVQLVGGSAGGKKGGGSTFGPLRAPAHLYVIQFGERNGDYIRHQQITIEPNATVTINPPTFAG